MKKGTELSTSARSVTLSLEGEQSGAVHTAGHRFGQGETDQRKAEYSGASRGSGDVMARTANRSRRKSREITLDEERPDEGGEKNDGSVLKRQDHVHTVNAGHSMAPRSDMHKSGRGVGRGTEVAGRRVSTQSVMHGSQSNVSFFAHLRIFCFAAFVFNPFGTGFICLCAG